MSQLQSFTFLVTRPSGSQGVAVPSTPPRPCRVSRVRRPAPRVPARSEEVARRQGPEPTPRALSAPVPLPPRKQRSRPFSCPPPRTPSAATPPGRPLSVPPRVVPSRRPRRPPGAAGDANGGAHGRRRTRPRRPVRPGRGAARHLTNKIIRAENEQQRNKKQKANQFYSPWRRLGCVCLPGRPLPRPETGFCHPGDTPTLVGALSGRRGAHAVAVAPWRPGRFAGDSAVPAPSNGVVRHADGLP